MRDLALAQRANGVASPGDRLKPFRFKPGQSGNPRGRVPDLERFETIADRILHERVLAPPEFKLAPGKKLRQEEIIVRKLLLAAGAGELEAIRILLDRKWPKAQRLELDLPLDTLVDVEAALDRRIAKAAQRTSENGSDLQRR